MTWESAMRWARIRTGDDGRRRAVYGYRMNGFWFYAVGVSPRQRA